MLLFEDELVGVMTFGFHPRKSSMLVLDRLCFKDDVSIAGGASRLFKFLLKNTNTSEIVSWSENRWSQGDVYKQLGFSLDADLSPDYTYYDHKKRLVLSKQSQKKSLTKCPKGKTEHEWASERGLCRIWDCGKKRWKYKT